MKHALLQECLVAILVLLFAYAACTKLMEMDVFRLQMSKQAFPPMLNNMLALLLPPFEILLAIVLVFKQTRKLALHASVFLLLAFAVYAALIVIHIIPKAPCSCGGIISSLSWPQHLLFNAFFLIISLSATILHHRHLQHLYCNKQGVSQKPVTE